MACLTRKDAASRSPSIATGRRLILTTEIESLPSEGLAEVRRYLARRLPALKDAPVTETRVLSVREHIKRRLSSSILHPEFENVWLVGGGSGHGFKHGPVVGEYVVARIESSNKESEPRFSRRVRRASRGVRLLKN